MNFTLNKVNMDYKKISKLTYYNNCTNVTKAEWDKLIYGAKRANKPKINTLVKKMLPDLYAEIGLNFYNPYNYFRTDTHLILVHSQIEYFLYFK